MANAKDKHPVTAKQRRAHKPDCQCVACTSRRKRDAEMKPVVDKMLEKNPRETPEYERLAEDYKTALEAIKQQRGTVQAAQEQMDRLEVKVGEAERTIRRAYAHLAACTRDYAQVVDFLRSASIVYHRANGHRGDYEQCDDLICRGATVAWFEIGQGPGVDLAKKEPLDWWMTKEQNAKAIAQFGDPGPVVPEDLATDLELETSFDDEEQAFDEEERETESAPGQSVDPAELDELPDSPAFAGKGVRRLDATPRRDASDPGMPKQARV